MGTQKKFYALFKTIDDMIDFAKKNPGRLSMGSTGIGTTGHFSGELFKAVTKITFKHVPFTGDGLCVTALMGGHIDFMIAGSGIIAG